MIDFITRVFPSLVRKKLEARMVSYFDTMIANQDTGFMILVKGSKAVCVVGYDDSGKYLRIYGHYASSSKLETFTFKDLLFPHQVVADLKSKAMDSIFSTKVGSRVKRCQTNLSILRKNYRRRIALLTINGDRVRCDTSVRDILLQRTEDENYKGLWAVEVKRLEDDGVDIYPFARIQSFVFA